MKRRSATGRLPLLGLLAALVALAATSPRIGAAAPSNPYFGSAVHTATGSMQPVASFAEDLDGFYGDDLVVADPANNSLDVMFHYGFGRFDDGARYDVAPNPTAVTGGLFRTGATKPDVAVASAGNGTSPGIVSVFFNDGSGGLSLSKTYSVGIEPAFIIATDINKDGKLDLISANRGGNSVSVLLGNGDGTFQLAVTSAAGDGPVWITAGDVNNDGNSDLVVANRDSDAYSVLLGNGSGSFQTPTLHALPTGSRPAAVLLRDFNKDGRLDLAIAESGSNTMAVSLGLGGGSFGTRTPYQVGMQPDSIVAINDGFVSAVAVANLGSDSISLLHSNGDGSFQSPVTYATGHLPYSIQVGNDSVTALTTVNRGSGNASILYENSDGTFQPASNTNGSRPYASVAADFNGDRRPDLAVANSDLSTVSVFLNAGNGTWQPSHDVFTGVAAQPVAIAAGDVNRDGKVDLVVVNRPFASGLPGNSVTILLGNGDGTFQAPAVYPVGLNPGGVALGDFNRDGNLDIAVADGGSGSGTSGIRTNTDVAVLLGNGDGTFKPASFFAAGNDPESIATADLNGDGKLDLVVDGYGSNGLLTLLGNGDGSFRAPIIAAGGDSEVLSVTLADMNGDGKLDAVLGGYAPLEVAFGNGDGTFTDAGSVDGNGTAKSWEASVAEVDVNGDGIPDYVTADPVADQVTVYINKGNGASDPGVGIPVTGIPIGASPQWLSMADFNGDGRPDIAVSDAFSGDIGLMLNVGTASNPAPGSPRAPAPSQVAVPFHPRSPVPGSSTTIDHSRSGGGHRSPLIRIHDRFPGGAAPRRILRWLPTASTTAPIGSGRTVTM